MPRLRWGLFAEDGWLGGATGDSLVSFHLSALSRKKFR